MLKKWSNVISCFVLAMVVLVGIYSNRLIPKKRPIKIGATYMTMNNEFYKILNAEIEKASQEHHYQLMVRDPELDTTKQAQQIETFVKEKVSVIILNPVKSKSSRVDKALKKAELAHIPVVVVDAPVETKAKIASTIISDNYQAGELLADHLLKTRTQAKILLLEHRNVVSATDRIQGFVDRLAGHPAYQIVGRIETYGQTEIAMPQVEKAIDEVEMKKRRQFATTQSGSLRFQLSSDFDVIMALNDRAAIGAIAALEDRQVTRKIGVYGVDGSPDFKHFIGENERALATSSQSPVLMGQQTAYVIKQMLDGKKVAAQYKIPVKLVTSDNVKAVGILDWQ